MTSIEHDNDTGLADFLAGWDKRLRENEQLPMWMAVLVLTNFGEQPVPSARLAEVLARPVSEAEARAQGHCTTATPAEDGLTRVEDGLITFINSERTQSAPRRVLQIGDRRFGMTGCAPDVFLYAPLVRPSLHVEETCPATGTPIRVVFTPSRVEHVEPSGAVVPILPPREFDRLKGMSPKEADARMCAQCPFYSSADAAQEWLAAHPGGRVFPVREAWDLSFHREWRDRMSALLKLDT
ncbi:MAG TPA: organomercurial lyase [Streptosporangiaceae bacterium]